jgi:hypothetical protein
MAFGMQDTVRLCEQYRAAMQRERDFDGRYGALSDRVSRLERAVRFMATVASVRRLTDDDLTRLLTIAQGQEIAEPSRAVSPFRRDATVSDPR